MIGASTVGLALLPGIGAVMLLSNRYRKTGQAVLAATAIALVATVMFQYLALRPRPEAMRQLMAPPGFPSYPSGHAAIAFSAALVLGLSLRGWWWLSLGGATFVAFSRVYLGHHYPTDIMGGAVLGATVGAACYAILGRSPRAWHWLLWPQIALALIISQMAYLHILPFYILRWPLVDKAFHFLLFGAIVFWLNLWLQGKRIQMGSWAVPIAILIPLSVTVIEEGLQHFSPYRTLDAFDLLSDLAGMIFFWWLSMRFVRNPVPAVIP